MNAERRSRQRGVCITAAALDELHRALVVGWEVSGEPGRLTHEARAKLMDVSSGTAKKILARKAVDRSTLVHAFRAVGIDWSEDLLEIPSPADADAVPSSEYPSSEHPSSEHRVIEGATLEDKVLEDAPLERPELEATYAATTGERPAQVARRPFHVPLVWLAATLVLAFGWVVLSRVEAAKGLRPTAQAPASPAQRADWTVEYDALVMEALNLYHQARYDESRQHVDRVLALAGYYDTQRHVGLALKISGDLYAVQGRDQEAMQDYETARVTHLRMSLPPWAELHEAIGLTQMRLGNFAEAERNLRLCLERYQELNEGPGIAAGMRNLGTLAMARDRFDEANQWFARGIRQAERVGKPDMVADMRGRQGMILLRRNRPAEALPILQANLAYWQAKGHARWIATCELRLAEAEAALGRLDSARERLLRSRRVFSQFRDAPRLAEVDRLLRQLSARSRSARR